MLRCNARTRNRVVPYITYKILQVSRRDNRPRPCSVGESFAIERLPSLDLYWCNFQQPCLKPNLLEWLVSSHQVYWKRLSTVSKCSVLASKALSQIVTLNSGGSLVSSNDFDCSTLSSDAVWLAVLEWLSDDCKERKEKRSWQVQPFSRSQPHQSFIPINPSAPL